MTKVIQLPKFKALRDVKANTADKSISLIFEATSSEHFEITVPSDVVSQLVPVLLEKSPQPDIEPMSFSTPLSMLRTAIDENGSPLLGLFFPSSIPISLLLNHETMSLLKQAVSSLESKTGVGSNAKH